MPSSKAVTALRAMLGESVSEEDEDSMFTDEVLQVWIDDSSTLNQAALTGWHTKLAHYANLVNVTDGASAREMGTLFTNAQAMVKLYTGLAQGPTFDRARVGKIVRHG